MFRLTAHDLIPVVPDTEDHPTRGTRFRPGVRQSEFWAEAPELPEGVYLVRVEHEDYGLEWDRHTMTWSDPRLMRTEEFHLFLVDREEDCPRHGRHGGHRWWRRPPDLERIGKTLRGSSLQPSVVEAWAEKVGLDLGNVHAVRRQAAHKRMTLDEMFKERAILLTRLRTRVFERKEMSYEEAVQRVTEEIDELQALLVDLDEGMSRPRACGT